MITVSAKELRLKLSYYLDQLERGEEITIIRNSHVIGHLKPTAELQEHAAKKQRLTPQAASATAPASVTFRQLGVYDDAAAAAVRQAVASSYMRSRWDERQSRIAHRLRELRARFIESSPKLRKPRW